AQLPTPATPTVNITQPSCSVALGTITVAAPLGVGLTYSIDGVNYNTTGIFANVAPGNYSVIVLNNSGCSAITAVTVNVQPPTPSTPIVNVTQPTCTVATGTITVTSPVGAGLTYSIDGVDYTNTTGIFTNVAAVNYNVTVKNSSRCISAITAVTVNAQPPTPSTPVVNVTQPTCTIATGTITVTSPVGAGLNYSIDGINYSNTTGVFINVPSGNYTVTVKNSSTCVSVETTVTVNAQPPTPSTPVVNVTQPTCAVATGTITVTSPVGAGLNYSIDGVDYTNTTGTFI